MDMRMKKNLRTLYRAKLVNYILEATQENLLTSSSTVKRFSARTDLYKQRSLLPIFGEE
jgi:hypothetical protein